MKINYCALAALFACVSSSAVSAQAAASAKVDSVHPQLLRAAKPAKSGAAALKANTAPAKSSGGATATPARVVQVPAITTQSAAVLPKDARAAIASDSGTKAVPPVARSAKVAKAKPPGA